jgi:hypothetical protein
VPLAEQSRLWLLVGALGVLLLVLVQRAVSRLVQRRRLSRRMRRARQAEQQAPRWLTRHGYTVTAVQLAREYTLTLDAEDVAIQVRADYLVERKGRTYVAEVKSGQAAPSIQTQATRRQLLEYRMAFDVDGVLLVDAETQRVHVVGFPRVSAKTDQFAARGFVVAALLLGLLCVLVLALR